MPVIRNHRKQSGPCKGNMEIFSLYIDNFPEQKDHIWLQRTFNKFGEVNDAFITRKSSLRMGKYFKDG